LGGGKINQVKPVVIEISRPVKQKELDEFAIKVFTSFRKEQEKHGNIGCMCMTCQRDMINAVKNVIKFHNKK